MGLSDLFANNLLVKLLRGDNSRYDLIASMVGTRLGDRVLVVGGRDGRLVATVGAGSGLTGRICAVEPDAADANAVEEKATAEGVLVEVNVAPLDRLPYELDAFDVAVVAVDEEHLEHALTDLVRVLRPGGRCVIVQRTKAPASDRPAAQLKTAGFRASRLIAERSGFAFYEGLKAGQG